MIASNNLTSDRGMRNPRDSLDASKPPLSEPAVGNVTATSPFNFESGRSCYSVTHTCPPAAVPSLCVCLELGISIQLLCAELCHPNSMTL